MREQPPGIIPIIIAGIVGYAVTVALLWKFGPLLAIVVGPLGGSLIALCIVIVMFLS